MEGTLFNKYLGRNLKAKHGRETERGQLMEYFCKKINATRAGTRFPQISMPRMGRILEGIPTKDLYYLKVVCDNMCHDPKWCSRRSCNAGQHFSMKFFYELNPHKHGTVAADARIKAAA